MENLWVMLLQERQDRIQEREEYRREREDRRREREERRRDREETNRFYDDMNRNLIQMMELMIQQNNLESRRLTRENEEKLDYINMTMAQNQATQNLHDVDTMSQNQHMHNMLYDIEEEEEEVKEEEFHEKLDVFVMIKQNQHMHKKMDDLENSHVMQQNNESHKKLDDVDQSSDEDEELDLHELFSGESENTDIEELSSKEEEFDLHTLCSRESENGDFDVEDVFNGGDDEKGETHKENEQSSDENDESLISDADINVDDEQLLLDEGNDEKEYIHEVIEHSTHENDESLDSDKQTEACNDIDDEAEHKDENDVSKSENEDAVERIQYVNDNNSITMKREEQEIQKSCYRGKKYIVVRGIGVKFSAVNLMFHGNEAQLLSLLKDVWLQKDDILPRVKMKRA